MTDTATHRTSRTSSSVGDGGRTVGMPQPTHTQQGGQTVSRREDQRAIACALLPEDGKLFAMLRFLQTAKRGTSTVSPKSTCSLTWRSRSSRRVTTTRKRPS
jgi:hypothetical protein